MTEDLAPCGQPLNWTGCYSGNYDLWCADAYQHPAKMAIGLCFRILEHLKELGLVNAESVILDPLGGIGTVALCANVLGFKAITVELEDKFVTLSQKNKEHLERNLGRELDWTILQGDSRYLSQLLQEKGLCAVTSPPYGEAIKSFEDDKATQQRVKRLRALGIDEADQKRGGLLRSIRADNSYRGFKEGYSDNPANIGNLKDLPLEQSQIVLIDSGESFFELPSQGIESKFIFGITASFSGEFLNIIKQDVCVFLLNLEKWNQLWEKVQKSIISGHLTTENLFTAFAGINPNCEIKLREFFFSPSQCLIITHTNTQAGTQPPLTTLRTDKQRALAIYKPSQISQIGASTHASIIRHNADIVKKDVSLKAILSPPYAGGEITDNRKTINKTIQGIGRKDNKPRGGNLSNLIGSYQSKGQIANLPDKPLKAITSPPYSEATHHSDDPQDLERLRPGRRGRVAGTAGSSEGNIGWLEDKPLKCLTSPPYEDSDVDTHISKRPQYFAKLRFGRSMKTNGIRLSGSEGQIGKEQGEDYLSVMSQVYLEIAKVADVLCIVIKDPTRKGKIRTLGLDTIAILEASGLWEICDYHRSILFEETETATLFGESIKKLKGRLSFFRRLSWQKGEPVSQWEHIIFAIKKNSCISVKEVADA